jgi:hypothetical protein
MPAVATELSGYAGNHLRSSSYGVSTKRERSRYSEAAAEFRCFLERFDADRDFGKCGKISRKDAKRRKNSRKRTQRTQRKQNLEARIWNLGD